MSTNISVGFSQHPDPHAAVLEACVQVKNKLNSPQTDLIIIFALPEYIFPDMHGVIARTLRPKRVIGSCTGRLLLPRGIANRGIALMGINSDDIHFGISAVTDVSKQDAHAAGYDFARKAALDLNSPQREVFIALSQGIEKNCSPFIKGIREGLGIAFPMVGAISSDELEYQTPFQIFQDLILTDAAVGVLIGGSFHLGIGCSHGFKPLGKPRVVPDAKDYVIRSIDNKPAIDIYKHFLGADAESIKDKPLSSYAGLYPLGFYIEGAGHYLLRNIIDILSDGSIVCHEGIRTGTEVHLMISNAASCVTSALEAAKMAKASLGEKPAKMVFVFESLLRHRILGAEAANEIEAIKNVFGQDVPMIGMCSYGELGPFGALQKIKDIYLHNESILIIALA
jgi:hypothetical protein